MQSVTVVTHIVTPYHAELFDALQGHPELQVRVIYLADSRPHRDWHHPTLGHPSIQLASPDAAHLAEANSWIRDSDLVVVGHYRNPHALRWISQRRKAASPWCFWGERPGFRFEGALGRAFRAWKLQALLATRTPIWGIGKWAVDGWRREFGDKRRYFNMPYFSDLSRFRTPLRNATSGLRRVLYSGSLIERKGVDLLAGSFARVAREMPNLTLDVVGSGPMQGAMEEALTGVRDRVQFHGFRQWAELPAFYSRADVLCVPSRYDGWGLVVPEGLASGLPVITTNRMGAASDLIQHGVNGWVAEAGDAESLQIALSAAARLDPEEAARMSQAAIQAVSHHQLSDGVGRFAEAVAGTLQAQSSGP